MSPEHRPRFSILVPAKNGAPYVGAAITSVLEQDHDDVEVIASVDASTDDTLAVVQALAVDRRLRVVQPPNELSMAGHYEFCLEQATGDWVTILGQDDAVMPYFFEAAEDLLDRWPDVEAISCQRAYFFWPGCEDLYGEHVAIFAPGNRERLVRSGRELGLALAGLREHFDLPQLYTNNLIRRDLLDRIRQSSGGRLFHELTPDVYSGVAISLATPRFLRVDRPLFWTGTSPSSTGLAISRRETDPAEESEAARAAGHFDRARDEGLAIADEVGEDLWRATRTTPTYVLSALRRVPFLPRRWAGTWTLHLAFAGIGARMAGTDPARWKPSFDDRVADLPLGRLRLHVLTTGLKLLLVVTRRARQVGRRIKAVLPTTPARFVSSDREGLKNILDASRAVSCTMADSG